MNSMRSFFFCLLAVSAPPTFGGAGADTDSRHLVILHINDTHGRLFPYELETGEEVGGIARLSTLVRNIREENEGRVLLLHAGDIFSRGDPVTVHYGGYVNFRAMERIGFDVLTPGNGEFYFGIENLQRQSARVSFPLIHANGVYKNHGGSIFPPYVIKEVDGVRIGILGLGVIRMWPPSSHTLEMRDPVETAGKYVPKLQELTDVIIALTHLGTPADERLVSEISGIDLVVGGHTHTPLFEPLRVPKGNEEGEVVIVNAGGYMRALGRLDVTLTKTEEGFRISDVEGELLPIDAGIEKDSEITRFLDEYAIPLDEVIHVAEESMDNPPSGENPMGNLVAEAMLAETRSEIAMLDRSAVRAGIVAGEVLLADVYRIHPWRNRVVSLRLTGAEIEAILSQHDILAAGCRFRRTNEGIEDLEVAGEPVDPERLYLVAAGEFFVRRLEEPKAGRPEPTGLRVNSALERYLRRAEADQCRGGKQ